MHHLSLLILAVALAAPVRHESPFACNLNGLTVAERARHFLQLAWRQSLNSLLHTSAALLG